MPFALLVIGAVLLVTAFKGTYSDFGAQLKSDLTGQGATTGFLVWILAIGAVGAIGYSPVFRTPARMLLALIILAMLLSTKGAVFAKLAAAFTSPAPAAQPSQASQDQPLTGSVPVTLSGGQTSAPGGGAPGFLGGLFGGGSNAQTASSAASTAADLAPLLLV